MDAAFAPFVNNSTPQYRGTIYPIVTSGWTGQLRHPGPEQTFRSSQDMHVCLRRQPDVMRISPVGYISPGSAVKQSRQRRLNLL
jgi:hypothetical protein